MNNNKSDLWKTLLIGGVPIVLALIALAFGYGIQSARIDEHGNQLSLHSIKLEKLESLNTAIVQLQFRMDSEIKDRSRILEELVSSQKQLLKEIKNAAYAPHVPDP